MKSSLKHYKPVLRKIGRHKNLDWARVQARLEAYPEKLWSLHEMERTGGEPDVVGYDDRTSEYLFYDCSPRLLPTGEISVTTGLHLDARKEHKPENSAMDVAAAMGIEILTEDQYKELQKLGNFDLKTSSWLKTPPEIRKRGGAIFGDRRYDHIFIYHNGAEFVLWRPGISRLLRV